MSSSFDTNDSSLLSIHSKRFRLVLLVLGIAILCPLLLTLLNALYRSFFELNRPQIVLLERPRALGILPQRVHFKVIDDLTGLESVEVSIMYGQQNRQIYTKRFNKGEAVQAELERVFDLYGKELLGSDAMGNAAITISARDRSIWKNPAAVRIEVPVDFQRPSVQILSNIGPSQPLQSMLVFFRAQDKNLLNCGVRVGGISFPGLPARAVDSDFSDPSVFAALVALPQTAESRLQLEVFAEDFSGNMAQKIVDVPLTLSPQISQQVALEGEYIEGILTSLVGASEVELKALGVADPLKADVAEMIKLVQRLSEAKLQGILKGYRLERFWDGKLFLPTQPPVSSRAWPEQWLRPGGSPLLAFDTPGLFVQTPRIGQEVIAAGDGIVLSAEPIGTFGNVVIIDHGFGLSTVYAYLDHANVRKGQSVSARQIIGASGQSGLARGPQTLFQIRVHGRPVDPQPWLNIQWYGTNIAARIIEAKRALGLGSALPTL